jgi:hypothetical protein
LRALAQPGGLLRKPLGYLEIAASPLVCDWQTSSLSSRLPGYGSTHPAIFGRRNTYFSAEDSSEMAWASVTNIEPYLDYTSFGLPQ